tara:strand:- start:1963 stop:2595 length:633 start_codon:yes stop_codon:yes gene_type:complete
MATAAWTRKEGKSESGGLNKKGIESYRRENPGSKLSMAVTTKPSKLKKGSKSANRRKSFCARMKGMKKRRTSAKTARDPNSRINKSLRKWNCEDGCTIPGVVRRYVKGGVAAPKGFHWMKKGDGEYNLMKHGDKPFKKHEGASLKAKFPIQKKHNTKKRKYVSGGTTKDACYHKVVSRYGPKTSAYRSGAMAKCRKVGAANWGEGGKKKK